jgi:hypothetical protein
MLLVRAPLTVLRVAGRVLRLPFRVAGLGLSRRGWFLFYTGYWVAKGARLAKAKIKQRNDAYDGLDGPVSFSACLIAGERWHLTRRGGAGRPLRMRAHAARACTNTCTNARPAETQPPEPPSLNGRTGSFTIRWRAFSPAAARWSGTRCGPGTSC